MEGWKPRPVVEAMTLEQCRAFIASAPFRHVKDASHGNPDSQMDPHEYIIGSWDNVDSDAMRRFTFTIRARGYLGRYTARYSGRSQTNHYLIVDDRVYWFIPPMQLCRTLTEFRQHEPVEEQTTLW